MEIVVLVKQVPDTESLIEIEGDGVSIKKQDIKWVMNPYDQRCSRRCCNRCIHGTAKGCGNHSDRAGNGG